MARTTAYWNSPKAQESVATRIRTAMIGTARQPNCELRRAIMTPEPAGRPLVVRLVLALTAAVTVAMLYSLRFDLADILHNAAMLLS